MPETLDMHALLSASQAAGYAKVTVATIVNWRTRGYCLPGTRTRVKLPVARDHQGREIRNARGRPMYRLADVVAADAATYEHRRVA